MEEQVTTGESPEEQERGRQANLELLLEARDRKTEERLWTQFESILEKYAAPDPDSVPRLHASPGDVRPNRNISREYASLPEEVRQWRNPDTDFWVKQWAIGAIEKDREKIHQANAKLEALGFGHPRADLLEGAPDATSGGIGAGTGAELLPHPLAQVVMVARDRVNKIRRFALPLQMGTQSIQVPTVGAVTAYMVAEGSTATQGEPDPGAVLMRANKAQAYLVGSKEWMNDSAFNVVTILSERAGGAIAALEDTQVATSNGTAPNISAALSGGNVAEQTSGTLSYADVVKLYFAVPQAYRSGAVWFGSAATLEGITSMTTSGRPTFQGLVDTPAAIVDDGGQEGSILRRPVFEFPLADGVLFFGNIRSGYAFASRQTIEAEVSTHVLFASDKVAWKFTERFDGNVIDQTGMKQIAGITTYTAS